MSPCCAPSGGRVRRGGAWPPGLRYLDLSENELEFVNLERGPLLELLLAADYLGVKSRVGRFFSEAAFGAAERMAEEDEDGHEV